MAGSGVWLCVGYGGGRKTQKGGGIGSHWGSVCPKAAADAAAEMDAVREDSGRMSEESMCVRSAGVETIGITNVPGGGEAPAVSDAVMK